MTAQGPFPRTTPDPDSKVDSGGEKRALGVVGTLIWDRIFQRDGRRVPIEEWGGISYGLEALSVALPEGQDLRVAMAARRLKDEAIAEPIVLGKPQEVAAAADEAGVSLDGITVVNPADSDKLDAYARAYVRDRDLNLNVARRMVRRPLREVVLPKSGGAFRQSRLRRPWSLSARAAGGVMEFRSGLCPGRLPL